VFSVSISGFVWLCFLLVTPWCSKIPPSRHRYLFVAGNILSAFGLHRKYQFHYVACNLMRYNVIVSISSHISFPKLPN
jgi:hypothetical protein